MSSFFTRSSPGGTADFLLRSGPVWEAEVEPPALEGRYTLGHRLGRGAFGAVWAATDRITGEAVAIKRVPLPDPAARRRVRLEIAALRALQIPGVVRLLDEGEDGEGAWIAMERVEGAPFPGHGDLWPAVIALLRTLSWVHRAGLIHRDLKPDNVLVTAEGRVVVLDFGVVEGIELSRPAQGGAGSPRWMAPEQLDPGPIDAAVDRYALGVMIWDALAPGQLWTVDSLAGLRAAKLAPLPRPPESPLGALLPALLDPQPAGRPTVDALLERLLPGVALPEGPLRFGGPARVLRLPARSAAALVACAGADAGAQRAEAARWLRLGLATVAGEGLVVSPPLLDALERSLPSGRRGRLGRDDEDALPAALSAAEALLDAGQPTAAIAVLEGARALAREARGALLTLWARAALSVGAPGGLDVLLFEVGRSGLPADGPLERLLRAAARLARGAAAEATILLDGIGPLDDPGLEIWRVALGCRAAARQGQLEAALDAAAPWAQGHPAREAALWGWRANQAYATERYAAAAEGHRRAALGKASRSARLASRLNEASARVELGELDAAEALAAAAEDEAAAMDHRGHGLRAAVLRRTVVARRGAPAPADPALVEVARVLGEPALLAPLLMAEAALAWRSGRPAAALAREGAAAFTAARGPQGATLLEVFAAVLEGDRAQVVALLPAIYAMEAPGLAVQALALAAQVVDRPALRARHAAIWARLPPGPPLELLGRGECEPG